MRIPLRSLSAAGAATLLALVLGGCNGTSTGFGAQPAAQQTLAKTSPDAQTKKRAKPTEIINQFNSVPNGPQPTNFEMVFKGNLVAAICGPTNPPCANQPLYGPYDPFCPPSQGPSNPCYPTVTYNPSTNTTTVTYAGATLYQNIPGHTNYYHFGLFASPNDPQNKALKKLEMSSYWSYPSSPNAGQPIVSINSSGPALSGNWAYAQVFVSVSLQKGGPVAYGTWSDVAYVPQGSAQPKLSFANYGSQPLYVVSSGIIPMQSVPSDPSCITNPSCSEDMAILQSLNFAGSPPPGEQGSQFVPLTYPPASILKPTKP